ncbi:hypothetical protein ACFV8T_40770 [Streptomyces sp. NPDC059832]|uniref:hypothetical protein n=1 Tax=unclassified Streptomyces TaxID=2593676 RepID=UPI0036463E9E
MLHNRRVAATIAAAIALGPALAGSASAASEVAGQPAVVASEVPWTLEGTMSAKVDTGVARLVIQAATEGEVPWT